MDLRCIGGPIKAFTVIMGSPRGYRVQRFIKALQISQKAIIFGGTHMSPKAICFQDTLISESTIIICGTHMSQKAIRFQDTLISEKAIIIHHTSIA